MSALAQMAAFLGCETSGSDRAFRSPENRRIMDALRGKGVRLYPQDGSRFDAPDLPAALVCSTAIEKDNPDLLRAPEGIPCLHRSEALRLLVDARDIYTRGHSDRVSEMAGRIAKAMGRDEAYCQMVRLAGLFHDIGKIGVPDQVLMKDSPLTLKQFYDLNVYDMIEFATVKEIGELMVGTIYCALHYWVLGDQNRAMELEKSLNWMYNKYLEDNSIRVSGVELPPLEVLYAAVVDNFIKTAPPQLAKRLEQLIKVNAEQQKARENEARKIEEAKSPLPGM